MLLITGFYYILLPVDFIRLMFEGNFFIYIILNSHIAIVLHGIDRTICDICHKYTMYLTFFVIIHAAKAVPIGINKSFPLIKILIYAKLG